MLFVLFGLFSLVDVGICVDVGDSVGDEEESGRRVAGM